MNDILLFPCNGNAIEALSVIRDINKRTPKWNILGFVDDDEKKHGKTICGVEVLGGKEVLSHYKESKVLVVPGRPENFHLRKAIIESLGLDKDRFAKVIHPTAQVGIDCEVGRNVLIMANVVFTASVKLGNHIVVLPNSVIAHGAQIGDYSLIGSNVSISGDVQVGHNCYIGTGARVAQEIEIGNKALVGLGSVVIDTVAPQTVVAGNPARKIRMI